MRRCTRSTRPDSKRSIRYLPRRSTCATRSPLSSSATASGSSGSVSRTSSIRPGRGAAPRARARVRGEPSRPRAARAPARYEPASVRARLRPVVASLLRRRVARASLEAVSAAGRRAALRAGHDRAVVPPRPFGDVRPSLARALAARRRVVSRRARPPRGRPRRRRVRDRLRASSPSGAAGGIAFLATALVIALSRIGTRPARTRAT